MSGQRGRPPVVRGEIIKNPVGAPMKMRPSEGGTIVHEYLDPCRVTIHWKDSGLSTDEINCQGYSVSQGFIRFVTKSGEQVIPIENVRKIVTVKM